MVIGTLNGTVHARTDQLWRVTRRHIYGLQRRKRLVYPEELCRLMQLPAEHPVLDRMAERMNTRQALRACSQAVHGDHGRVISQVFKAAAEVSGGRVRVGFWGSGPMNSMAMVFDEQLGAANWEYVLRVEGNAFNAEVHDHCWGERVLAKQVRMEEEVRMPDGVAPPAYVSLHGRCQPWSKLDHWGPEKLGPAVDERFAVYHSVQAIDPDVVVDEMLSRAKTAGKAVAWQRVEKIRKEIFVNLKWVIADSDPGEKEEVISRSRRELAVGFKAEVAEAVKRVLLSSGYRLVVV